MEEEIKLTTDELIELLRSAYYTGYATYEIVEAGLESYDSESYARYVVQKLKSKMK